MDPCGGEECDTVVTVGQGACQKGPPPLMEAVHLKDHLATNPSEYSYFDSHRMCAWAGPAHWKIRPLSKSMYHIFLYGYSGYAYIVVFTNELIN